MRPLLPICLIASLPMAAAAAIPAPGTEEFICDVPGGRYDQYTRNIGPGTIDLRGTVVFNEFRGTSQWHPVVNIILRGSKDQQQVGLRFVFNSKRKVADVVAVFPGRNQRSERSLGTVSTKERIPVQILIDEASTSVEMAGTKVEGPGIDEGDRAVALSCSSIDAHIKDITINIERRS